MNSTIEIGIFIAGFVIGAFLNYAIYAWAYFPRAIAPWQRRAEGLPPLPSAAYLPVFGWLFRRGESAKWGRGFWIRPMVIEALVPLLLVALYRAMMDGLTIPLSIRVSADGLPAGGGGITATELRIQFLAYSAMFSLLTVASFIDLDERSIPDAITMPGTWLGVIMSLGLPGWTLWEVPASRSISFAPVLEPMHANSPHAWDTGWDQLGFRGAGLWIGLLIWWIWCFSFGNLRWIARRGIRKAFAYAWAGFWRSPNLRLIFAMWLVGTLLIGASYAWLPAERWRQLFSSLMGIGLGGLLPWSFRIVSCWVMQREALGFGDVTLMAMVGAHFGWQIAYLAFFLAPIFGIALGIAYWTLTRDAAIPFGPFLASATAYLMLDWARVWDVTSMFFLPLNFSLLFLAGMLVLLGSLLWSVQSLKVLLDGRWSGA